MAEDLPLAGQVALVTGSARRIGRAIALSLAREGATVIVHARSSLDEIEAVAREIHARGGTAAAMLADVTDEQSVATLAARIDAEFGRTDILVNNAAIRSNAPLAEMSLAEWTEIHAVTLTGAFLCTRAVVPGMVARRHGRIISIGGLSGHAGASDRAHVAAAKAGLVGFTKAVAVEFAAHGITANCVAPGKIGGPRSASSGSTGTMPGGGRPLIGRDGYPEEVADVVRLLALPTGAFITGQTLHVNGGLYLP